MATSALPDSSSPRQPRRSISRRTPNSGPGPRTSGASASLSSIEIRLSEVAIFHLDTEESPPSLSPRATDARASFLTAKAIRFLARRTAFFDPPAVLFPRMVMVERIPS